ncbi:uncharacterized protein LOC136078056 [Hydra vulgaris]|uniref:Uncharacterized protein LOC136078056 n=1 Tax=Hydra vulgaris TaxID=6087 RepID=A0ABM4BIR2_HYDVU
MIGIPNSKHIESSEVPLEVIDGPIQTLNGYRNLEEQCGILANKGTLKKLPFLPNTALCQLECVMKRDCTSTVSEIHSFIGSHLRMAPFRKDETGKSHLSAHFLNSQDEEA